MLRVLFCGLKYEYGKSESGLSFEYRNFYESLKNMSGVLVELFPVDEIMRQLGKNEMNKRLINLVEEKKYDLVFCFLFTEEIKKSTIEFITKKTKTFNWFADDHWRLPVYSRFWAPLFTMVGTTDSEAPGKYRVLGINNVIKTQWGVNQFLYKPGNNNYGSNEITFVGKKYGNRGRYIEALTSTGLKAGSSAEALAKVEGYGAGWSNGRTGFKEMLEIFSNSKINLNFTESPYVALKGRLRFLTRFIVKRESGRLVLNIQYPISNIQSLIGAQRRQIKGRTFEIPACGGFLLTEDADNLKDYYVDGKEIVIFKDSRDMIEKCRYYLENEEERKNIARAGFERTIRDHTYEQRFREIFKAMELIYV